jgi:hypothetical protein
MEMKMQFFATKEHKETQKKKDKKEEDRKR